MTPEEELGGEPAKRWIQIAYQLGVVVPLLTYLALTLPAARERLEPSIVLFVIAVAAVDLIPVQAWGGIQLSLDFPLLLGVAIIFDPAIATLIALLGSVDPREFRREVSLLKAVYNRSQIALSILIGSVLFHVVADPDSVWYVLLFGTVLAAFAAYALNTSLVAGLAALQKGFTRRQVLVKMHGPAPYEFLFSYIGLGLFGAVIAQLYLSAGFWSVVVFLGPLVFARQMYFRNRALADRLAEQNEVLADQTRRLEELLQKEHHTVGELIELNRMKGEFVAVVSHELRTPVTALMGYAKTLRQPEFADDDKMREEFLERMERQSDRLLRLIENLLTASNLETHQLPVAVGRVLFEDLVREVMEGLANDASRVQVDMPDDLPVLTTDRQLLTRVLQNLVDNALKYSPDGSPCELEARSDGEHIVFSVRDYGIGIPPDELPRIFDRFYQVDSSSTRTFRGAGLGLSLVRDLLDHLGGSIDVQSTPGDGSKFIVTIPIRYEPPQPSDLDAGRPDDVVIPDLADTSAPIQSAGRGRGGS